MKNVEIDEKFEKFITSKLDSKSGFAEVAIELDNDTVTRVSNFIAKYEEFINLTIDRFDRPFFIFKLGASSIKEIARICDIMSEDIDVIDLEILSTEGN